MKRYCVMCLKEVDPESANVLAMGGYGIPRCICDECSHDIEEATTSKEYEKIVAAMDRITKKLSKNNIDDAVTVDTVSEILVDAAKRATEIQDGTYDFSSEESGEGEFDEIPEELRETEEDRLLDQAEEKRANKIDKAFTWVWVAVLGVALGLAIWWFFFR